MVKTKEKLATRYRVRVLGIWRKEEINSGFFFKSNLYLIFSMKLGFAES